MGSFHFDSFSGAVANLNGKEQRDPMKVLAVLVRDGRISCFDRGPAGLEDSIDSLKAKGLITEDRNVAYPWCRFFVTPAGTEALARHRDSLTHRSPG